jgi:pimeloyl-ACP methyl ester carboxylesterase
MCVNWSRLWVRFRFKTIFGQKSLQHSSLCVISVVHSPWLFHDKEVPMLPCWLCWAAVAQLRSHRPSSGVANGSFQLRCFIAFVAFFHAEWGEMSSTGLAVTLVDLTQSNNVSIFLLCHFLTTGKSCLHDSVYLQSLPSYVRHNLAVGQVWPEGDVAFHRKIVMPTLLVHGLKDPFVSLVEMCEMERVCRSCSFQTQSTGTN